MGNQRIDVDGEVEAGWTSYWNPDKHGDTTMSETVSGTSDDDLHSEITEVLPSDINPDDLTDKQRTVIEEAVNNPYQSAVDIDEKIDSVQYANKVLAKKVPEFYKNVFKQRGSSIDFDKASKKSDDNEEDKPVADAEPEVDSRSRDTEVSLRRIRDTVAAIKATAHRRETEKAMARLEEVLDDE